MYYKINITGVVTFLINSLKMILFLRFSSQCSVHFKMSMWSPAFHEKS